MANGDMVRLADGSVVASYRGTPVACLESGGAAVVLDSGGWRTATTKRHMNQALSAWGFHAEVYQQGGAWFVRNVGPHGAVAFADGMRITREAAAFRDGGFSYVGGGV